MNKTHTINISGIIFHIDEFAYDKLKDYLNTIRSYFKDSEGRDEIMTDIESRIAELFTARLNPSKQVILMDDVDYMISIMGSPEVFKNEDGSETHNAAATGQEQATGGSKRRRLFRDNDEKVLGGVCSGIGNYFDIDPIWIRLAFAASFFYFGSGFLFYLVLWVVIPEAKTTAEKLEMKGEKVNINNIEKSLKEEMEGIKNRFNSNVTGSGAEANKSKFRNMTNSLVDFVTQLFGGAAKFIIKFIGFILVFIGIFLLVGLLTSIFGHGAFLNISDHGISSISFTEIVNNFFMNANQIIEAKLALFLLIGIPVLLFIYSGVRILAGVKTRNKWLNVSSFVLWLVGLALGIHVLSDMSSEFKNKKSIKEKFVLQTNSSSTLYLKIPDNYKWGNEDEDDYDDEEVYTVRKRWGVNINNEKGLDFYMPVIDIQKSATDSFELVVIKSSKGRTNKEALKRAQSITYAYTLVDSSIVFNPKFEVQENDKWRAQRVKIIVKVPVGKSVYLSQQIRPLIYDIDNITNTYDGDMVNHKWTMQTIGLSCVDCGTMNGFDSKSKSSSTSSDEDDNY